MIPVALRAPEVRCSEVLPVRCNEALRASSLEALTDRVRAHGASVHGFTPAWYSRERIAAIARGMRDEHRAVTAPKRVAGEWTTRAHRRGGSSVGRMVAGMKRGEHGRG